MNDNQLFINNKLKEFAKKYYLNKLLKGAILFFIITFITFIIYAVLEYFSYFNSSVRLILFYSYLLLFLFTLIFYIVIPLVKIFGLGKQLTPEQIAKIIGKHFPEIDDKLLNIIQLNNLLNEGNYKSIDLLLAAIDTKTEKIKPFPILKAIPFNATARFLKWTIIPILCFILIFSIRSEVFTEAPKRIVHYETVYEKPAPYSFQILNSSLKTFQHDDFVLNIKVLGEEVPQNVYIAFGKKRFKCDKLSNSEFSYTLTNLQKTFDFQLVTDEVYSKNYTLTVLPKPITIAFAMELNYPSYLNKNKEVIENNGNATVPEGTRITWKFYTKNTDSLLFISPNKTVTLISEDDNYSTTISVREPLEYGIVNVNAYYTSKDTLKHSISVIKDLYPEIFVQSQQDSMFADRIYFKGNIKDDYGFSLLQFVYSKYDDEGNLLVSNQKININIVNQSTIQDFYYYFDAATLELSAGYKIDYYFQVYDNDGVNGKKMAKTIPYSFRVKTMEEINKEIENSNDESKDVYKDLIDESAMLMKDIEKLNQQLLQTNNPSWQDKKKMEALLEKFNELKNQFNELKDKELNKQALENQFKNINEDILKKQAEVQKRLEDILTDEMKAMLEQMQQMMQKMDKDQMKQAVDKMKLMNEDINKSLDQQLELFKQLEFDKLIHELIDKSRELSDQQKLLSKQTESKAIPKEELMKKQQQISDSFDQLQKDLNKMNQLNKELEDPNKLTNTEDLQKSIKENMQDSQESLKKNNRSNSSQSQQKAAESLEELSNKLETDINENELENVSEDIETLRQILDNLVQISFHQEDNLNTTKSVSPKSSLINDIIRNQFNIQDNMRLIDDSLNALAKRQTSVKPFIQKEVTKIRDYLLQAQQNLNERKTSQATSNQQFVLTSMNNLSLMLAESMKEMKEKQSECKSKCNKSGNGSCNKPGGKGKKKSARELQQQLNRQLESLKRSLEQGQQQGENQQGQSLNEQFARMAAQQEAIRKMMQDYQNEMKSNNGVGDKTLEQLMQEMEKTEKELVNKTISQQTINRVKNIETRLLESERADLEKEKEEKRESNEGRQLPRANPPKAWNNEDSNNKQIEMLKSVPPNLNYYYKEKTNQYFFNIE